MKEKFLEYYSLELKKKEKMWGEAVFVFDANVLLNLYRYSEKTRKEFLNILEKMGHRIWLPHQFALEYQRNRLEVIEEQSNSYADISVKLQDGLDYISKQVKKYEHRHPFLKIEKLLIKITNSIKLAKKEVEVAKSKHPDWFEKDPIRERLDQLFKGKVGEPCKNIEDIERQGAIRFSKKVPPGYEDIKKDNSDPSGTRKYGDWVGWYQIMEMAKEIKKPIIFVTGDRKGDWWLEVKGKMVGPRPELIKEISQNKVLFHMYTMENFLEYAKPIYKVKQAAIKEIGEVNKRMTEEFSSKQVEYSGEITPTSGVEFGNVSVPPEEAGQQITN